jgi:hypothetical protein
LKDIRIGDSVHLEMHDSKKPNDVVVDNLYTDVNRGDTVIFMKARKTEVQEVVNVILKEADVVFFSERVKEDSGLYMLVINPNSDSGTFKYVIKFRVKHNDTIWTIDPYLKIPL